MIFDYTPKEYQEIHVLIVGDSKVINKVLQDFLVSFGIAPGNFHYCTNSTETLALLETVRIDLILTSLWLPPPSNGLELLEEIRGHNKEEIRKVPFVMLVGKDHPAYREKAHNLGISGYLTKPFKAEALKWVVDRIFLEKFNKANSTEDNQESVGGTKFPREERQFSLKGMKVMLVDDSPTNLRILKNTLAGEGLVYQEASSAEAALQKMSEELPDLIVLDVVMAGMDGFEVCRILKNELRTRDIPIIFLTSLDQKQSILEGFHAGGVDYISKPFVPEEVKLRIQTQLQLTQVLNEKKHLISELVETKEKNEQLIDELLEMKEDLERQAITDPLTGLANRRGMWKFIEEEQERVHKGCPSFSVILSDVDFFKKVNDSLGHEAGDQVLVELSKRLKTALDDCGVLARWGGEEFLVLLPLSDQEEASKRAEILRREVSETPFEIGEQVINVTMSFGVAALASPDQPLPKILQRADEALYRAKKEGRNCVVVNSSLREEGLVE